MFARSLPETLEPTKKELRMLTTHIARNEKIKNTDIRFATQKEVTNEMRANVNPKKCLMHSPEKSPVAKKRNNESDTPY